MKNALLIIFILLSLTCGENKSKSYESSYLNYNQSLSSLLTTQNTSKPALAILIDKSEYKLTVLYNGVTLKEYPVVLGTNPIDDKRREGDRCTPEGKFKVRGFYPHKSWEKFIWIDYPTADSWKKHKKAKAANNIPESATIGGEIGIHGVPANKSYIITQRQNWTWGCISLKNEDINEIYPYVFKGMHIEIIP